MDRLREITRYGEWNTDIKEATIISQISKNSDIIEIKGSVPIVSIFRGSFKI
jgi:hypothetical protein